MTPALAHTILAVAILIAYTVLTALGLDGTAILALLGGQALGGAVQAAASAPSRP